MSDEPTNQPPEPQTTSDAWREVGKQFEALGQSLATAFRTIWEKEENRKRARDMRTGLEAMVNQVGQALQETAATPQAQKVRSEAEKAAQSLGAAGKQTWQEARPHLVSALRQISAELQKTISQLEQEESAPAGSEKAPGKQDSA